MGADPKDEAIQADNNTILFVKGVHNQATGLDKGYQSMTLTVKWKTDNEVYKTLSKAVIKENAGLWIERMSVIEEGKTMILLMDQRRIVVSETFRKKLMDKEHLAHPGIIKMQNCLRAKYFWLGIEANVRRIVEACEVCQLHMRSQAWST